MNEINILITDDHPFFRDGMRQLLSGEEGFKTVEEACNGQDALDKLKEKFYDIVIMDIKMPVMDGIAATQEIKKNHPGVKVLAMSMFDEQPYIVKMMRAGAKGYLLKNSGKDELVSAIWKLVNGENYFGKDVSELMMSHIIEGKPLHPVNAEPDNVLLTKREMEIIKMIAEEHTNVEIGDALGISPRTVDTHRRNLLQKLKVKNSAGLVKYAIKNGIL